MVLADFLTETGRKCLQAFKLFKSKKNRKSTRNRVSPALERSFSGTVDARPEIDIHRFCPYRLPHEDSYSGSISGESNSRSISGESTSRVSCGRESQPDSAYESDRGSPGRVCYTVTYFNVSDSDDSSSIHTEYTLLDYDADCEETQNFINESIELVCSL